MRGGGWHTCIPAAATAATAGVGGLTAGAGVQSVASSLADVFPVVAFKLTLEPAAAVAALAAVDLLWFKYMVGVSSLFSFRQMRQ